MTMSPVFNREIPKPRYKNTVICKNCHAEFKPSEDWVYGNYAEGTTGEFRTIGKIPFEICPVCRKQWA